MNLNIPNQLPDTAFERLGYFGQSFEGNFLFSPLNIANIISRQISPLGQCLLAQPKLYSFGANLGTQRTVNFTRKIIHQTVNETRNIRTIYQPLVGIFTFHLLFNATGLKPSEVRNGSDSKFGKAPSQARESQSSCPPLNFQKPAEWDNTQK